MALLAAAGLAVTIAPLAATTAAGAQVTRVGPAAPAPSQVDVDPAPPQRLVEAATGQPAPDKGVDAKVLDDESASSGSTPSGGTASAATPGASFADPAPAGMTTVEILHTPPAAGAVKRAVAAAGGSVTGEVSGSLVQAAVPDGAADALATVPGVLQVRPPADINLVPDAAPILQAGSVNSESVAKTLAGSWHNQGLTGAGVNVAIVDLFDGPALSNAVGTSNLANIDFANDTFCRNEGAACDIRNGGSLHGVAVAEIVHDMAPGAKVYYVTAVTTADLRAAVDWMASKGVSVVNRSMGAPLDGPGNGTGPLADVAAYAVTRGITWVNSAGNAANGGYWRGGWSDPDGDRFLNFNGGDEFLEVNVFPCAVALGFRWSDWGPPTTRTDYDIYIDLDRNGLIDGRDAGWETNQRDGAPPIEMAGGILGNCAGGGQTLSIAVRLFDAGAGTGGDVLELLTNGAAAGVLLRGLQRHAADLRQLQPGRAVGRCHRPVAGHRPRQLQLPGTDERRPGEARHLGAVGAHDRHLRRDELQRHQCRGAGRRGRRRAGGAERPGRGAAGGPRLPHGRRTRARRGRPRQRVRLG